MDEKTTSNVTVDVTMNDGTKKQFDGDTALILTLKDCRKFMNKEVHHITAGVAYMGADIPTPIYPETIAGMIASFTKSRTESFMIASYDLHRISELLEKESRELACRTSKGEQIADVGVMLDELFKDFHRILDEELRGGRDGK